MRSRGKEKKMIQASRTIRCWIYSSLPSNCVSSMPRASVFSTYLLWNCGRNHELAQRVDGHSLTAFLRRRGKTAVQHVYTYVYAFRSRTHVEILFSSTGTWASWRPPVFRSRVEKCRSRRVRRVFHAWSSGKHCSSIDNARSLYSLVIMY